jgi:hypothetical protein
LATSAAYPVHVSARLEQPSRWLWIVKWFLAIPHYVVLAFLWMAFCALSVVAFFAILFTGRYPRGIFGFNVGVLRWSWRVAYYTYGALATDRYPPFTMDEDADYPAHLEIDYPVHLSRSLVLVKWWLLAIPHYIIVGLLLGGVWMFGREAWPAGGLIGILALVAGVILAFTGQYPQTLFDLVLGLNRWVLRVAAYAGLMTDEYPPFRLDLGGSEPNGSTLTVPRTQPRSPEPPPSAPSKGWTGGRITSLVIGSILILGSLGSLAGGIAALIFDRTQRDAAGFVTVGPERVTTSAFALTTEGSDFIVPEPGWRAARAIVGTVRIRITPAGSSEAVFVGIAEAADVQAYLGTVERATPIDLGGTNTYRTFAGVAPDGVPAAQQIWATSASGTGPQTVEWEVQPGSWVAVVMNQNATAGVDVRADVGARVPALAWIAAGLLACGAVALALGIVLVNIPIRKSNKS